MKKTKVFISKLLLSIITISLSWQASLGLAIQCKEPELSSEKIIAIIQQERTARTDLPEEVPNSSKKVSRNDRCYYIYKEYSKYVPEDTVIFILNEKGIIVDLSLHLHVEHGMSCPATDPSLEYLANRLHVLREQEPELPKAPSVSYTTSLEKFGCIFYFIEESDDGNIRQIFLFDAFGGLEDYLISN